MTAAVRELPATPDAGHGEVPPGEAQPPGDTTPADVHAKGVVFAELAAIVRPPRRPRPTVSPRGAW